MTKAKIRVIVAAVLLAGWIGYLGYLAATTSNPVVLSRPQLLSSSVLIVGAVSSQNGKPDGKVVVETVFRDNGKTLTEKQTIDVKFAPKNETPVGWDGAGSYILALSKGKSGYIVTPVPPSPGYPPRDADESTAYLYRIYLDTPATRKQFEGVVDSQ